jgi:hypothetical protein
VIALVSLAMHGWPLCEPMRYAQMGGMICATFIKLLQASVIYSIFVLDLKLINWGATDTAKTIGPEAALQRELATTGEI